MWKSLIGKRPFEEKKTLDVDDSESPEHHEKAQSAKVFHLMTAILPITLLTQIVDAMFQLQEKTF